MLLDDLEPAIGPAMALLLVGLEAVGQQAVTVAAVGVMGMPAEFEQRQAEIGVLADGVARPAAGSLERGAAHQAHGAVDDDGIVFVPLHHADVEEAGIFGVHRLMHNAAFAVAVILRRLNQTDVRIAEQRHQILEPILMHDVIGIEYGEHFGVGGGVHHGETQRAGLEADDLVGAHELETFAEQAAVLFDRSHIAGSGVLLITSTHSKFG